MTRLALRVFAFGVTVASLLVVIVTLLYAMRSGGWWAVQLPFGEGPFEIVLAVLGLVAVIYLFARDVGDYLKNP